MKDTTNAEYTRRLNEISSPLWKRVLNVQAPYRFNIRRLKPGFTLDIGCGIGRSLAHLDGNGVGIDHNPHSVEVTRSRGIRAYTVDDFKNSDYYKAGVFDSIMLAHVAEHMTEAEVVKLLKDYLFLLKSDAKLILITPQEVGHRSDPTHVEFMDLEKLVRIGDALGFKAEKAYSFPFPRFFGHLFIYNEFIYSGRRVVPEIARDL